MNWDLRLYSWACLAGFAWCAPVLANDPAVVDTKVDVAPLPLKATPAFAGIKWTGWQPEDANGRPDPLRPIVLTDAGDGTDRVFVATQHGVIHVFPNRDDIDQSAIFLDITDRVRFYDKENEEGFLGLAFHPKFKENGKLYVYYTTRKTPHLSTISSFQANDDRTKADPASEEIIMTIPQPFWNHNGGTICFGPDGFLYLGLGDGGAANDPLGNGQKMSTWLGKILRIDVDKKDADRKYAVPPDNPFVGKEGTKPEIWASGVRNIWRMAFDRKTGTLWAGDVGQDLWEEIDIIVKGGNYGWNLRESKHPFGKKGVGPRPDLIEPIWEYHHSIGKSITGGSVYRGKALPELQGAYIYADYVSCKVWALWYDEKEKRVIANREIPGTHPPILSFGEDQNGEIYYLTYSLSGKGIFKFVKQ